MNFDPQEIIRSFRLERDPGDLFAAYSEFYADPRTAIPRIIVNVPPETALPCWEERLADPEVMLACELLNVQMHQKLGDDSPAAVRVQFGTAQIAAAFGCEMFIPPNSLPCAGSHVLHDLTEVRTMKKPETDAGWGKKLRNWTQTWLEQLPEGVTIQNPDYQSAFNSAHLIRGNDIFTDFYDDPENLDRLLELITDFMLDLVARQEQLVAPQYPGYFCDWGALWRGRARISNCSMHMTGPELYREQILKHDRRFFSMIGAGRIHYCGSFPEVIPLFASIPGVFGMDIDHQYHDFYDFAKRMPEHLTMIACFDSRQDVVRRLLNGEWPENRNLIVLVSAPDLATGRNLLNLLRQSAEKPQR